MGREVTVGRIAKVHGVRGEVIVQPFGETPGLFDVGASVCGRKGPAEITLKVAAARPHKGGWIVSFEGVAGREEAEALAGMTFVTDADELPHLEEGTYYRFQLVGLEAATPAGESLGEIEEVWETGASDILVIRGSRGEILVPAIEEFLAEVDVEGGRVVVKPVEGLIPEDSGTAPAERAGARTGRGESES